MKTLEELRARLDEIVARLQQMDDEHAGERFSKEEGAEWNDLCAEREEVIKTIKQLELRHETLNALKDHASSLEAPEDVRTGRSTSRGDVRTENIWDLSTLRAQFDDPAKEAAELKSRALRAVEQTRFPSRDTRGGKRIVGATTEGEIQAHIEHMLDKDQEGRLARYLLCTGAPAYKRAFPKLLTPGGQALLSREEQAAVVAVAYAERALSLTGSAGGFAVPFELDPTIIPTSNLAVNPFRAIGRVENISVDEWRGVSSAGVTAAYAAEGAVNTDNAPTLAQPTVSTEKAQAFIPYSIEVGMDWPGLRDEMASLLADAKDELEATKFVLGTGTNEPQGVITGATTIVTASGTGAFALVDLDTLEAALPPRFRARASIVMNRFVAQRIRRFDTAGGAGIWIENTRLGVSDNVGPQYAATVNGYPAYEASAMDATTTTGSEVAILGDFNHYVIADRIGLTIDLIPHLFDVTNNRPTGQRGIYAYWRNGAGVVAVNAFRVLRTG